MDTWMIWLALAGVVVMLELFTGTFYLLMIAIGVLAGSVVAYFQGGLASQLLVAGIVGAIATIALHKSRFAWKGQVDTSKDPNVNMDIGQFVQVSEWQDQGNGRWTSRTSYRGALWDVELPRGHGEAGRYQIEEVQGNRLIVKPM
jgi:membrane protein implicated in regulation of membrane protease activity